MEKVGLVLEGGGMRGIYTGAVLDVFLDNNIIFPYILGVSAGACQSMSYISKQRGRNLEIITRFGGDSRYLSWKNQLLTGSIFGMDFAFKTIPNELIMFDYETFHSTDQNVIFVTTSCVTGEPGYYSNKDGYDMSAVCQASSSMPGFSHPVPIDGIPQFDGGMVDPVPIMRSIADGNTKNVVILTRNKGYRKSPSKSSARFLKILYRRWPKLAEAMAHRAEVYNKTMDFLDEQESLGKIFIIRPEKPVEVGRLERNVTKLQAFYDEGIRNTNDCIDKLNNYLNN